jgi:outer membrane immunogenic protein
MKNNMRAIQLFFVFTIFSGFVNAQKMEKVSFGFGAGLNIAGVSLKSPASSVSPYSLNGFKGYVFIDAPLGKNFFLQPELAYDGMGWQFDGDDNYDGGQQSNVKTYLNYLTLAVLPKYKIENTGLAFYAGPAYGFLLSATVKGYGGETHDDKRNYTGGDFGGIIGAEYYLSMGLGISARYLAGISNVISNAEQGESMHTHAFSVSIAYKLNSSR